MNSHTASTSHNRKSASANQAPASDLWRLLRFRRFIEGGPRLREGGGERRREAGAVITAGVSARLSPSGAERGGVLSRWRCLACRAADSCAVSPTAFSPPSSWG